ncbi:type II toxin-antitoxin system HicB family antitoxin [Candidatus Peregrinibacteria bacterium]|nr:type II toxin-antitoxin system HicB family antitoxin [Candidatus Peregrinibacteria bacterium]
MTYRFPIIILQNKDGMYTARVPTLRGCHTQAKSLPQLHKRMREVIALCAEVEWDKNHSLPHDTFVGFQQIDIDL